MAVGAGSIKRAAKTAQKNNQTEEKRAEIIQPVNETKQKSVAKAPAKSAAKTPAKGTAKTPAKSADKTPAKRTAKASAKRQTGNGVVHITEELPIYLL